MEERLTVPGQGGRRKLIMVFENEYVVDHCILFSAITEIVRATLLLVLLALQ
jgi:hypothetical protein